MADQQRWFKFWHSALSDDRLISLPIALRWAWVAFGAHTKVHGEHGVVTISPTNTVLAAEMGVSVDALLVTVKGLPHMHVEEGKTHHGEFTVTWHNWIKYQEDSTQAERQRASRSKRRREEKRGDEKRTTPHKPPTKTRQTPKPYKAWNPDPDFDAFWQAYPKRRKKDDARMAWEQTRELRPALTVVLNAIEAGNGSRDWQKNCGQYIPLPASWLRASGWQDLYEPDAADDRLEI